MSETISENFSTSFDEAFKNIQTLKWLPWVGLQYNDLPTGKKLLIIGESHYLPNEEHDWYEDVEQPEFTRGFITDNVYKNPNKPLKILRNLEKVLIDDTPSIKQQLKLFNSVSYYNFIQRALGTSSSADRPNDEDYEIGWSTFFKVLNILEPNICLFCGVSFTYHNGRIERSAKENNYTYLWDDKIDFSSKNVKARKIIITKEDKHIPALFIAHPTLRTGFNCSDWRQFIDSEISNYTSWLRQL